MTRKTAAFATIALLLISFAMALPPQGGGQSEYDTLRAQAEREYAEKSFQRAHDLYERVAKLKLSDEQRRWVDFRLADTAWRAGSEEQQEAIRKLQELVSKEPHDRVWAEANESLGDFHGRNYNGGQQYYLAALDFWAGSDDIDYARRRYLDIVWRMVGAQDRYAYTIPREVLVNALTIANTDADRARVRYLLAWQLVNERTAAARERALEHLEAIIALGRKTEWYDDALFLAGQLWSDTSSVYVRGRNETLQADFVKALGYFRRLLSEFKPDETRWYEAAKQNVETITAPTLHVGAAGTFLPDSEQQVLVSWRNVKEIRLALTAVDLTRDVDYREDRQWFESIRTEGKPVVRTWELKTNDTGEHKNGSEAVRLQPRLAPGAYVLTASAAGQTQRTLVLVSDLHVLVQAAHNRLQVFVSDVMTGEPVSGARVAIWQQLGRDRTTKSAQTNGQGIAEMTSSPDSNGQLLVTAAAGERQAYHATYHSGYGAYSSSGQWRIYAFTDRPAYRPEDTVQWKIIARVRDKDRWVTPAGTTLEYEIVSPRGDKVATGKATLSDFGTFSAELPLTTAMPLGAYAITFKSKENVGQATLFRLEEYKLPEFRVSVKTDKQYRLGDVIEAQIEAEYYFGGPVANAEVEAVVYQRPFVRWWHPWRERYAWYFPEPPQYSRDSVMKRETLRTDANGRATLRIETQADGNETSYRIEARVVDASRREVRGEGTVRVTRQRYSVFATPEHYVHAPGESVSIDFKAMDANDQPVATTGTVTVVRRQWRQERSRYAEEEVTRGQVTTDAKGEATFTFTPKREGYYVVTWVSEDGTRARDVITAETTVWVADRRTTDLGYRIPGGLDVIVDKETFRAGQTATVMLVTPSSGRWVVLTTTGDEILDTQVIRLDGTVKVVQVPIDERHVPNFFITASSVFDRQIATDMERVVVPPVEHFIDVEVKSDREEYRPREEGTVTVTTRDADGKPISAEVALAVSDESVTAIQADLAGDPRPFFFGEVREQILQVTGSVHSQRYVKLVVGDRGELVDEEEEQRRRQSGYYDREEKDGLVEGGVEGGVVGGVAGGVVGDAVALRSVAPPPPPAMAPAPETITVTAQAAVMKEQAEAANIAVEVRSDFRNTALWKPDLVTDKSGTASVKVKFPESLTTWRATARAASRGAEFGMGTATSRTNLPLIVRLQAPRFFVAGDRVVVSAVINNNTAEAMTVTPSLDVEGLALERGGQAISPVRVEPHSEARADWTVVAEKPGPAKLRVTARGTAYADAMERTFTVYDHGIDKLIAQSGKLRGSEALVRLDLPRERRGTDLVVQVAPSLAVAMLDALPYLIEYPYGCTEQTMSRFLPAAIVARTLQQLGLDPKRVDDKKLRDVTAKGMARLYDFQHSDGGWGWWKEGSSDDFMTAYVVWGFSVAREGGLSVRREAVDRAAAFLQRRLVANEGQYNDQAWMLHALSAWRGAKPTDAERRAFDEVWKNREQLTSYSRALLALTAHRYGDAERAAVLVRNLENGAKIDAATGSAEAMSTAHWGEDRFWWRWYDGPVESTAFVLQALVAIDPKHRLVEPAMNWLVKNRRGAQWSNTRDTAISLLALNDYLKASGELAGDVAYELTVNGRVIASKTIPAAEVLSAPSRFSVDPSVLAEGAQEIRIRRTHGTSPLYFAAEARFFSLEEPVKAAGNELFVKREYFRLAPRPTLLKGVQYDRVPLRDRDTINSGERVEVVVTVEAKNDYSYLMFEDLKPAGFEAVALQSGQPLWATQEKRGRTVYVYQELRDRKVAMFIDHIQQGVWEIRYTLRAEVPGSFHALPLLGQAMYVPDIRGNSDEVRVTVEERVTAAR